ncbi:hypothetical protein M758_9G157000 [Ceratodon purpureus]|nr:hypothetical protein M758_9G157000 [Ceratodon purpureus]
MLLPNSSSHFLRFLWALLSTPTAPINPLSSSNGLDERFFDSFRTERSPPFCDLIRLRPMRPPHFIHASPSVWTDTWRRTALDSHQLSSIPTAQFLGDVSRKLFLTLVSILLSEIDRSSTFAMMPRLKRMLREL